MTRERFKIAHTEQTKEVAVLKTVTSTDPDVSRARMKKESINALQRNIAARVTARIT